MPPIRSLTAVAVLVALAHGAGAQTAPNQPGRTGEPQPSATKPGSTGAPQTAALSREDRQFIEQAAQNGHAEVQSSKLALEKASSADVKAFAQHMVKDHAKANEELKALAASKGVEVPDGPSLLQRTKQKVLSSADGADFDRRYVDEMGVQAHRETIELFRKASQNAQDPQLKQFATKTLPTLQEHMKMAQDLKTKLGQRQGSAEPARTVGAAGTNGSR